MKNVSTPSTSTARRLLTADWGRVQWDWKLPVADIRGDLLASALFHSISAASHTRTRSDFSQRPRPHGGCWMWWVLDMVGAASPASQQGPQGAGDRLEARDPGRLGRGGVYVCVTKLLATQNFHWGAPSIAGHHRHEERTHDLLNCHLAPV